jgi:hypothetical protein
LSDAGKPAQKAKDPPQECGASDADKSIMIKSLMKKMMLLCEHVGEGQGRIGTCWTLIEHKKDGQRCICFNDGTGHQNQMPQIAVGGAREDEDGQPHR